MSEKALNGLARLWKPGFRVEFRAALSPHRRGSQDPTMRLSESSAWRCFHAPTGPVTLHLRHTSEGIHAQAWGAGASWALDAMPDLFGAADLPQALTDGGFEVLKQAVLKHADLRIGRTGLVWEALAPAVLEQRVTGKEARRSWAGIVNRFGEVAPGPAPDGMRVPPSPATVARIPSWEWHRAGVDGSRSSALVRSASLAARFEGVDSATADRRLRSMPGIGVWTSAEVRQRAHGDPDAISVGDYHLAAFVGTMLTGRAVDDAGMVELLAPWAGQRQRLVNILMRVSPRLERKAPRATITDHRNR